ncbi:hypothetical protein AVEN_246654-1 [Araneus ventricosus]|uniref:Uncharacterized protein n=1 Tax=Araneus ventricosus TaxID=182803 RepID=A0A4Y2QKG4_ARAVE|nr:hypothetical protein AVEN_246654-1 [Araneus ventricosus]
MTKRPPVGVAWKFGEGVTDQVRSRHLTAVQNHEVRPKIALLCVASKRDLNVTKTNIVAPLDKDRFSDKQINDTRRASDKDPPVGQAGRRPVYIKSVENKGPPAGVMSFEGTVSVHELSMSSNHGKRLRISAKNNPKIG